MSVSNTRSAEGKARYIKVRAAFVGRNTTLNKWCVDNGLHIQNVRAAFFGNWEGAAASALIARVETAAGVE